MAGDGTTIGPRVADLDEVAFLDGGWQQERPLHVIDGVAGRSPQLKRSQHMRLLHSPADEPDRKIEAEMGCIEQDAVAAVIDVEVVAAARIDAHDQALRL